MILATANTGNFEFQALAATKNDANSQLLAAWRKHCKQYAGRADARLMRELVEGDEVNYVAIELGQVTRDGEVLA